VIFKDIQYNSHIYTNILTLNQGCGSGSRSELDPDSEDFVDPDPYWESGSGSRGKKIKKFQWKNALFSYFCKKILPIKRYNYFLKKIWMNNTNICDFI
jgi:hypothetical protein